LDALDALDEVTTAVVELVTLCEAVFVRGLDADKDGVEPGLEHEVHELLVVGEVDGDLCVKGKTGLALAPLDEGGEYLLLEALLVADKIVVDEKDRATPAEGKEAVEFGDDLVGGLCARAMAKERSDVAELAVIGAAARELDVHRTVAVEIEQVPARGRGLLDVREGVGGVDAFELAVFQVGEEERQGDLGLTQDQVVDGGKLVRFAGEKRSTGDDRNAEGIAARDDVLGGFLLDDHTSEKDIVSPEEVVVGELGNVHVDQLEIPVLREQGGDGQKTERRCARLFADELESVLEAPERVRKFRVDQQYLHLCSLFVLNVCGWRTSGNGKTIIPLAVDADISGGV
jgi:hypothetical protein